MRTIGSHGTQLISRDEWGARAPRGSGGINPVQGVTAHWEGPTIGTVDHGTCYSLVRGIQAYHMDGHGWVDVAYNGIVCSHGYVFEGRGPGKKSAGHGEPGNSYSYALCFLSGVDDPFTDGEKTGWADGRQWLMDEGGASATLHCHRDWMNTACPGDERCAWVKAGADAGSGVPQPVPAPVPAPVPDPGPGPSAPLLRWGSVGAGVSDLQTKLSMLGYSVGGVDGDFGNKTLAAVKAFQTDQSLMADGIVGPMTWGAIDAVLNQPPAPAPDPVPAPAPDPVPAPPDHPAWPGRYFVVVTRGGDVQVWQQQMADRGWSISVDGVYGPKSAAIALQFQTEKGLGADGVVGPVTWDAAWTSPLT